MLNLSFLINLSILVDSSFGNEKKTGRTLFWVLSYSSTISVFWSFCCGIKTIEFLAVFQKLSRNGIKYEVKNEVNEKNANVMERGKTWTKVADREKTWVQWSVVEVKT